MASFRILGSCSGTEPMPDRQHTSVALSVNDSLYFLDAGEGCARSAHLQGENLLNLRAVFLSHTHFDHIGGLAGLLWHMRKLTTLGKKTRFENIRLYIPQIEAWEAIESMLRFTEGGFLCNFTVSPFLPAMGVFYKDENLCVSAYPSYHLPDTDGLCRSFSYRLETEGHSVVFSGDVHSVETLERIIGNGCDVLLMETGHHKVADVCRFVENRNIGKLILMHHGREILNGAESVHKAVEGCPVETVISWDGMQFGW